MTNVISYLVEMSNEQKAMFKDMQGQVLEIKDSIDLIAYRIKELSDKLDRM
jgi:methyl-accepting chemotaxis protein|tara:strand:- start:2218 stop:2370 length:153 start_codon:yes stop_codon:yes gene_type:complete